MKIPLELNNLSVEEYIKVNAIYNDSSIEDSVDRHIEMLSYLTGESVNYFNSIPNAVLKVYLAKVGSLMRSGLNEKPKRIIRVKGKLYKAIHEANKLRDLMSANQFTAFAEMTKDDPNKNLNTILPLMYAPYKLFRKPKISEAQGFLSEEFKLAKMGDISGTAFFFAKLYGNFIPVLESLRGEALTTITDHLQEVMASGMVSEALMDGTRP